MHVEETMPLAVRTLRRDHDPTWVEAPSLEWSPPWFARRNFLVSCCTVQDTYEFFILRKGIH